MMYNTSDVIKAMKAKDYSVFENDDRAFNLNIVGIRNSDRVSNKFNDTLLVFYKHNGVWHTSSYNVTVDPGTVYRKKPINAKGTAIIMPGQYPSLWKHGLHRGKYKALVQNAPCTVARDNNKDATIDVNIPYFSTTSTFTASGITTTDYLDQDGNVVFVTQTGMFGINCHKSGGGVTEDVNYYSAGCVVFEDNEAYESKFLVACGNSARFYGDGFTFTLLNDNDVRDI